LENQRSIPPVDFTKRKHNWTTCHEEIHWPGIAETMAVLPNSRAPVAIDAIRGLLGQKKQIREAAVGKIREGLTQETVVTIMRLARDEPPERVLSPGLLDLVRQALGELEQRRWRPDTALFRRECVVDCERGAGHGASA
jgi:hypothetical protein